jgi:hypothetical protein
METIIDKYKGHLDGQTIKKLKKIIFVLLLPEALVIM